MIPRELIDRVKIRAAAITGIPAARMLFSATHTAFRSTGDGALGTDENPATVCFLNQSWWMPSRARRTAWTAAKIGWTVVKTGSTLHNRAGFCARIRFETTRLESRQCAPTCIRLPESRFHRAFRACRSRFTILSIQRANGQPLAVLANYSMHYVGAQIKGVSADISECFASTCAK